MNRPKKLYSAMLAVLSILGLAASIYLLYVFIQIKLNPDAAASSICNINERINCETVAASEYSIFLGIPLAIWGIMFYSYLTLISFVSLLRKAEDVNFFTLPMIFVPTAIVLVDNVYLAYIQSACIKSICIFCFSTYLVNILILLVIMIVYRFSLKRMISHTITDIKFLFASTGRVAATLLVGIGLVGAVVYTSMNPLWPTAPMEVKHNKITKGSTPDIGNPKALVKIYEVTDYLCPHCAKASAVMHHVAESYKDKVYLRHVDYPLEAKCNSYMKSDFHPGACQSAMAVRCAAKQNQFWSFHFNVFKNQRSLSHSTLLELAKKQELDMDAFMKCLEDKDGSITAGIKKDIEFSHSHEIRGTPTFVINGKKYEGLLTEQKATAIIDNLLKKFQPPKIKP